MQNITGIYKITNLINGKIYIGKSLNIKARIQAHKSYYKTNAPSKNNKYWHNKLYTAMREFGIDNFSFEVIEECKSEELDQKEIYWINYYDSYNNGYNMTLGGDGGSPHETNARALLTLDDVINIRTLYNNLIPSKEVYPKYQDRISLRGFQKVWRGETWTDVMPEVYTEENKLFHKTKAKGSKKPHNRILSDEEIYNAWQAKSRGENLLEYYNQNINGKMSFSGFQKIWFDKNKYQDVREKYALM